MFGAKKEFQVLIKKDAVELVAKALKAMGVQIFDLREAEIRGDIDDRVMGSCYVLRCRSTMEVLNLVKSVYDSEQTYEGYRTFY